jgi:hypothetical protein
MTTPITAPAESLSGDERPTHYRDFTASVAPGLDPNGPDVVATITCDTVDADNEVVLPQGADLSRYVKAPRVMLCHAYGRPGEYYPLPIGKALWTKRQGRALVQGIRFARSSAMGREVQGLFEEGMLNTFSIGFVSLDASRPTTQEKALHPDWKDVGLVHRRWKLLEVSVVPIPCNEDAVGTYLRKGRELPEFVRLPSHFSSGQWSVVSGQQESGSPSSLATSLSATAESVADRTRAGVKAFGESDGASGGYLVPPDSRHKDDEPRGDERDAVAQETAYKPEAGHFVKWPAHDGMHAGCGKCMSIHKSGRVPDVANEAHATEGEPHARVKLYKPVAGDPHTFRETDHHVAVKCRHCAKMDLIAGFAKSTILSGGNGRPLQFLDGVEAKGAVPYAPGPVVDGRWDAGAARARLKAWAGGDMAEYRRGFAWYDAGRPDELGSYKLPHHDVRGGRLVVVKEGVTAALAALDGARGGAAVPEVDGAAVRSHLERHKKAFDRDEPEPPKTVPPFRTRAQVLAGLERRVLERFDPEAVAARALEAARDKALGVI